MVSMTTQRMLTFCIKMFRKQICFQVSQPYRPTDGVSNLSLSECTLVSFASREDPNFKSLRHLHEKEIQTTVTTVDKGIQTEVRLPCNQWTQMELQDVKDEDEMPLNISLEVVKRLQTAVEETAVVDALNDDWGALSKTVKSSTFMQPLTLLRDKTNLSQQPNLQDGDVDESEPEEETMDAEFSPLDIIRLHKMKKKIMKKVEGYRTADSGSGSSIQRFYNVYNEHSNNASNKESSS